MGQSNNNGNVRVYEQAIEYDGFSMMAEREVTNWGQTGGFGESYVNGRIQNLLVEYDASGNVVSQPIDSMPEGTGTNTFDAAGRRVKYFDQRFGRFNGYLNMVQEHVTAYDFDGDGRPVVEKDNWRTYPRNDPPSGGLEATPKVFQVWSSVLGSNLVTIGGYTGGTKVFAGGTLIGTANANAGSRWTTADPVTGTTVRWTGANGVWEKAAEETEPLGQLVASADPDLDNDPGYDYAARNSAFPQWQCDLPDSFWAEDPNERFRSMPFECQQRVLQDLSAGLDEIYGFSNPNNEPDPGNLDHERSHTASSGPSALLILAASALQSSWKPKKKPKEKIWTVDISYVPGYVDASESGLGMSSFDPIPNCVKTLLRNEFKDVVIGGTTYNAVDATNFVVTNALEFAGTIREKLGIDGVNPSAMTLGTDVLHLSSLNVLNPSWEQTLTIIEEITHVDQFLQMWASMVATGPTMERFGEDASVSLGQPGIPTKAEAVAQWLKNYLKASKAAKDSGRAAYDNDIEREAKNRAREIMGRLTTLNDTKLFLKSPCAPAMSAR